MRSGRASTVRRVAIVACWALGVAGAQAQSFFRCQGTNIVDPAGNPFQARGLVLSGWLVPEAYGLKLNEVHKRNMDAYTDLRANIRSMLGNDDDAKLFWDTYTSNYVAEADLAEFKARGFNAIRVPFNYRLLMSVTNVPDVYYEEGFQVLDNIIRLCKTNGLAVLLDMHACPGGQSHDPYADPEYTYWAWDTNRLDWFEHGVAVLWESNAIYYANTGRTPETNKQRTVELWRHIAQRYSNETAILGYELINEPYFYAESGVTTNDMRDLFIRITTAVREADTNHIVFVEGNIFAEFIDGLTPPWTNNMAIAFHRYWRETGYEDGVVQTYLDARSTWNVPLLMTESGENSNPWVYEIKQLMDSNNIGSFWWGFKKVNVNSTVYLVQKTPDYQYVIDNWRDSPVDPARAKKGLMELANNVATTNCIYKPGYFEALFDPLFNVSPQPFADHPIPGLVHFSDYDVGNQDVAYHDTRYKNTTYGGEGWNLGWTYRSDGVDISACSTGNGYKVSYTEPGEWLKYTVRILHGGVYDLDLCTATTNTDRQVQLLLDGVDLTGAVSLPQTAGWDDFQHTTVTNLAFAAGTHVLEVRMLTNALDFSSMRFELSQAGFVDSDADLIDDHWEIRYGGDLDPIADPDHDGLSDLQEYYADTIPTNAGSTLAASISISNVSDRAVMSASSTSRVYFLQYRTNLMTGSWSNLRTNVPGVGGVLSLLDTNNLASGFYRVGAGRP